MNMFIVNQLHDVHNLYAVITTLEIFLFLVVREEQNSIPKALYIMFGLHVMMFIAFVVIIGIEHLMGA